LIERSFQGLFVAIKTVRIVEELMDIWPNEVCDKRKENKRNKQYVWLDHKRHNKREG